MDKYLSGQRWINDAEVQLGLGTILSVEGRCIKVLFPSTEEVRTYAADSAPLSRVRFEVGDTIRNQNGESFEILEVLENAGLYIYQARALSDPDSDPVVVPEAELDDFTQISRPNQRLFAGQIDNSNFFELRRKTLELVDQIGHSDLRGLRGARTSLIPHQLYIAKEVGKRFAPRVLLADEVGLGKTVEAGMILNQQLLQGYAQRVLIIVPETLLHQWLVEMLRRFNLRFSIFDESRLATDEDEDNLFEDEPQVNHFEEEQLVLCSLDFLRDHPEAFVQASEASWDLMVVDEAHHLEWTETEASPDYQMIELLARTIPGVLLLTATPEQLGKAGHFARLRLLDSDRFPSYVDYLKEEQSYQPIADAVELLIESEIISHESDGWKTIEEALAGDEALSEETEQLIREFADASIDDETRASHRERLVEHMLDRHGTGRVLFRNTRAAIEGFPGRRAHAYPLEMPESYKQIASSEFASNLKAQLYPEVAYQYIEEAGESWSSFDPRALWLKEFLAENASKKVLVIAANAHTAMDLAESLRMKTGEQPAVFHEGMSIVDRDRAAAYFADDEYGSQCLICSEIGSEGRNFQFAHNLVLFDLPLNPDLLEQRIGRLDRIGQTEEIQIHVPYLMASAQEVLYTFYQQAINAFEHTSGAAQQVYVRYQDVLHQAILDGHLSPEVLQEISDTHSEFEQALHDGRDRLLEYNSCRLEKANEIVEQASEADEQAGLPEYLKAFAASYGIDYEEQTNGTVIMRPSESMLAPLHSMPDEGMTATYSRNQALTNEDLQFISWDHPLISSAFDQVLSTELGNTSVVTLKLKGLPPGLMMVETLFVLESASTKKIQTARYLPATSMRVVLDEKNRYYKNLTPELVEQNQQYVKRKIAANLVKAKRLELNAVLKSARQVIEKDAESRRATALERVHSELTDEIDRLKALQAVNPMVRPEEIEHLVDQKNELVRQIESAQIKLDAMRVIVCV